MNNIENEISKIHGGSFFRLAYKSDVPLKAEFKKSGCTITKVTEKTCRLGVNYLHIGTVINRRETEGEPTRKVTNNYEWIIPNRIAYNTNTGKKYISIATAKKSATRTKYIITDAKMNVKTVDKLNDIDKEMIIDSYFRNSTPTEVQKICLDNILSINHTGRECFA